MPERHASKMRRASVVSRTKPTYVGRSGIVPAMLEEMPFKAREVDGEGRDSGRVV